MTTVEALGCALALSLAYQACTAVVTPLPFLPPVKASGVAPQFGVEVTAQELRSQQNMLGSHFRTQKSHDVGVQTCLHDTDVPDDALLQCG